MRVGANSNGAQASRSAPTDSFAVNVNHVRRFTTWLTLTAALRVNVNQALRSTTWLTLTASFGSRDKPASGDSPSSDAAANRGRLSLSLSLSLSRRVQGRVEPPLEFPTA